MVGIFLFSVLPGYDTIGDSALLNWGVKGSLANSLHVAVYAGLTWLWCRYLESRSLHIRTAALLAVVVAMTYGTLNEWAQLYVPGRTADVGDVVFNFVGTLGGAWIAVLASRRSSGKLE